MSSRLKKSLIPVVILGLLAGSLVAASCGGKLSGTITESGSTTVQPLAQALGEEFHKEHPDVQVSTAGGGSGAGITQVNDGIVDIGAASRELTSSDPPLVKHLLARDGITIITKPSNPVTGLTKAQVVDIFSGVITNWQDVGGPDHAITVYVREETSGTRGAFQELVMGSAAITSKAIIQTSSGAIKQAVAGDSYGVGFESMAYVDTSIKALDIDGIAATQANVRNGTYPIVRPLYFLTKEQPTGLVKDFIDFCQGSEGQKIVAENGYISIS
jgi:phosphate transport system substrate-binding protein